MLSNLRNYWGLAMFGMAIGFMGAVSTATGTTLTLLGLLFALIGGSLAPYFSKNAADAAFDAAKRREMFSGLGLFSIGLLIGILTGFTYQTIDTIWVDPLRMAPVEKRAAAVEKLVNQLNEDRAKFASLQARLDAAVIQTQAQGQNGQATLLGELKTQLQSLRESIDTRVKEIQSQVSKIQPDNRGPGGPRMHATPTDVTQDMLDASEGLLKYIKDHSDDRQAQDARKLVEALVEALRDQLQLSLRINDDLPKIQALIDKDDKQKPLFANSGFDSAFNRFKKSLEPVLQSRPDPSKGK